MEQWKKNFSLTIFFSETAAPWRTGPWSLERTRRALYAHIFCVQIVPIGADTYENRTRFKGNKGKKHFSLTIFLSESIAPRRTGPASLERACRAVYAHIFFGLKGEKEKEFFLTIFFPETIAPPRTGPGSMERARRALDAHISCVQIGPIGAEIFFSETIAPRRTRLGSLERALHALYAHIFFVQIGPIGAEIFFSETIEPRRTGPWSLERDRHALYAHIFLVHIGPIGADTYENRTRVTGKGSSRPLRPYFSRPDRANRSRFKWNKGKKHFSLTIFFSETKARTRTGPGSFERALHALYDHIFFVQIGPIGAEIFFSETIEPRRTGPGSLERDRHALYAHIFLVQIGPIGADTYENRTGVVGKGLSRPLRPYFCVQIGPIGADTYENPTGVIGNKGKKHFSLTIFFSETKARTRTGPGSLDRACRAHCAHIFCVQIGPIGAERTGLGSLERARSALYAHIFFVQIEKIGADTYENRTGVVGKGSSRPLRPYFLRPDRTNRSRVITD
ncbi:hypothetical protein V1477_006277 [Vespula maculifrons]|uniref:Uncharacterized protein n=1 Tax=Vespula maculifrons TaxID=7453 RepID=A0ABD2CK01_VESMC